MGVRIKKEQLQVLVMTDRYRIEGEMHVVVGGRLIDELNKNRDFIPLTHVTVYDAAKENRVDSIDFLAVHKGSIIFLTPMRAPVPN